MSYGYTVISRHFFERVAKSKVLRLNAERPSITVFGGYSYMKDRTHPPRVRNHLVVEWTTR